MSADLDDRLDLRRPVHAAFTLSVNNAADVVHASITFRGDGLQMLAPGGRVTVNDVELAGDRLQKQGYWYKGEIKRSPAYRVAYSLAASQPARTHEVPDRKFVPGIPDVLSRSKGGEMGFAGPAPGANERLFVELTGGDGASRWGVVLRCTVEGNRVLIPASAMAQARLGKARLYVGLIRREPVAADLAVTHAIGSERMVDVKD